MPGNWRGRGWWLRHGAGSPRSHAARSAATCDARSRRPTWSDPSPLGAPISGQASSELARFALVGVSNTALSLLVYIVLAAVAPPAAAGALAFAAGAANGYVWNRRWTFRRDGSAVRYAVVQAAGTVATAFLLSLVPYAVTLCVVTGGTFLANRRWTFSRRILS